METPLARQLTENEQAIEAEYNERLKEIRKIYLTRLEATQARSDRRLEEIEQSYATRLKEAQERLNYLRNSLQLRHQAGASQPPGGLEQLRQSLEWQSRTIQAISQELNALKATRAVRLAHSATLITRMLAQAAKGVFLPPIQGAVDAPTASEQIEMGQELEVQGWITSRSGWVEKIEVWLDQQKMGEATYGLSRPDVLAKLPLLLNSECGYRAGFRLKPGTFKPGQHTLSVHVRTSEAKTRIFSQSVNLQPSLEAAQTPKTLPAKAFEVGWPMPAGIPLEAGLDTV